MPSEYKSQYFERADPLLPRIVEADPVCLYLETTNRCNLLCETCPRTFEELEPPADISLGLWTSIPKLNEWSCTGSANL